MMLLGYVTGITKFFSILTLVEDMLTTEIASKM